MCRVGEALAALGRHEEALGYFTTALRRHERELRADTADLVSRLAVVEDLGRVCKSLATLGRPDAPAACGRSTTFADRVKVEPTHAFPRAFLAAAWTQMGAAYEALARRRGMVAPDRREYRALAVERYRRSHEIWADLQARGLVSPVDTGLVSASARNLADAGRLVVAADSTIVLQEAE
jgi:tetratricopeptide (TPR) repeat protein